MHKRRDHIPLCLALTLAIAVFGCGGGGGSSPNPGPPPVSVTVSPSTASVLLGATRQFTATVTNTTNTAVTWSVSGAGCTGSACGTIDANGLYTAPQNLPASAMVNVTATSQADSSRTATATVTITSDIVLSVTPNTANVELGAPQQFTATITSSGNPNRAVLWTVNGIPGGNATLGLISSSGLYTAPSIRPSPSNVTIMATSLADSSKTTNAAVTLTSNFTLTVTGPDSVDNGATARYTATVTPVPGSNPNQQVSWSVSGPGCAGSACGTIDATGLYTAPLIAPSPPTVSITATSVADPSKTASKSVTINSIVIVFVSPSSTSVELEKTQPFTATVAGAMNQSVTWDVNGIVGGSSTVGTITNAGLYTAPVNKPTPDTVTVRATSQFDPSKSGTSTVTLFSNISVLLQPSSSTRAVNRRETFSAQLANTSNLNVVWRVNNIDGGDLTFGRICVTGSNPCQQISVITAGSVEYEAPGSVPTPNQVPVTATSQADPIHFGSAVVTIIANVLVSVSPSSVTVPPSGTQLFTATVIGTPNQNVTWDVNGIVGGNSTVGTITNPGTGPATYTAPLNAPSPNTVTVTATSADGGQTGSATATIAAGPSIRTLLPASLTAGPAVPGGLTILVQGSNFASGATILFKGTAKPTTCTGSTECSATLMAADVATAGNQPVQVQNPGSPPQVSNQVFLVLVPMTTTEDVIPLTAASPNAVGKDITVVEPTTAGARTQQINIELIGIFSAGTCSARNFPATITRPASGSTTVDICITGSDLTTSHTYTITGSTPPSPNDITISNVRAVGSGVGLTLTLFSATPTGLRTLFVENANKEKSAASGAIEVK